MLTQLIVDDYSIRVESAETPCCASIPAIKEIAIIAITINKIVRVPFSSNSRLPPLTKG